jgi:hypothetical protein
MDSPSSLSLFLKRGLYCVRYVDSNGRRRQKSFRPKTRTTGFGLVALLDHLLNEKRKPILFSRFSDEILAHRKATKPPKTL